MDQINFDILLFSSTILNLDKKINLDNVIGQKRHALVQFGDWGWDDNLTWALGGLTGKFFLEGSWEARAAYKTWFSSRLVQHEGEGSQAWSQNTHTWGLEVSRALTVHITAKTNSAGLQEQWGNNLDHRPIGQYLQALLWDMDKDNIVFKALNNEKNLAFWALLDKLLTHSWEGD